MRYRSMPSAERVLSEPTIQLLASAILSQRSKLAGGASGLPLPGIDVFAVGAAPQADRCYELG
jgi:hypothetical protein